MQNYILYIQEFHNSNPVELEFVKNHLQKHLKDHEENQTEIETILDYLFANPIDISKIGYSTLLEKTEKWHKKLQSVAIKDSEEEWEDYEVFMDFGDGFKIVQLVSKESYEREGRLMSHCVSSYYGRDSKIYSLRDSKNLPHATIEHGQQIKGKGNWKIDPKYIDYIVKFLEKTWMTVRENEMKNLGYYKLDKIDEWLTSDSLYNGYIYEGKLDTLKDKEWKSYYGFWLFNIKDIVEFNGDFSFQIHFDIWKLVDYFVWLFSKIKSSWESYEDNYKIWSSGDYARIWSSGDSAKIGSSGDFARIWSSGSYAKIWSSGFSARIWSSGDFAKIGSSGDSAQISVEWKYSIASAIWIKSTAKWIIWTWIVLAEFECVNENWEAFMKPICVKSAQIDGVILKENTFYTLKGGEFVEVTE